MEPNNANSSIKELVWMVPKPAELSMCQNYTVQIPLDQPYPKISDAYPKIRYAYHPIYWSDVSNPTMNSLLRFLRDKWNR